MAKVLRECRTTRCTSRSLGTHRLTRSRRCTRGADDGASPTASTRCTRRPSPQRASSSTAPARGLLATEYFPPSASRHGRVRAQVPADPELRTMAEGTRSTSPSATTASGADLLPVGRQPEGRGRARRRGAVRGEAVAIARRSQSTARVVVAQRASEHATSNPFARDSPVLPVEQRRRLRRLAKALRSAVAMQTRGRVGPAPFGASRVDAAFPRRRPSGPRPAPSRGSSVRRKAPVR